MICDLSVYVVAARVFTMADIARHPPGYFADVCHNWDLFPGFFCEIRQGPHGQSLEECLPFVKIGHFPGSYRGSRYVPILELAGRNHTTHGFSGLAP